MKPTKGWTFHHVNSFKKQWLSQEPTRRLRDEHWLQPPLYDPPHMELHRQNPGGVPVPGDVMARQILRKLIVAPGDYVGTVDRYIRAIDEVCHQRSTDPIQRGIGELMMQAVELQRPFIKEGLVYGGY